MEKGNVLVIGNSGVGKSTLINAVLGENVTLPGIGTSGTTKKLKIYESNDIPFRLIDTIGFEPTFFEELKAVNAIKKWSKDSSKKGMENNQINVIWFCVDGTSGKLFSKTIKTFSRAISMWKSVPIIVAITKSYSVLDREQNIELVKCAFQDKKISKNLKKIIPVVASTYVIDKGIYSPPNGIEELINSTNDLLPEGIKAASNDLASFILNRKRAMAHGLVAAATAAGVAIGAAPLPTDSIILSPLELGEMKAISKIYGIKNDNQIKELLEMVLSTTTVSAVAKTALSALKTIPGINIAASVLNAAVAGCFVAAIGESSIYIFEQVFLGKKSLEDIDWITKVLESKLSSDFIEKATDIITNISKQPKKDIVKTIVDVFLSYSK